MQGSGLRVKIEVRIPDGCNRRSMAVVMAISMAVSMDISMDVSMGHGVRSWRGVCTLEEQADARRCERPVVHSAGEGETQSRGVSSCMIHP